MLWLQENWIIAVVGLVVAVLLLWFLLRRKKPEIETPVAPPAEPRKPLEAVKPEIIAAEPARFKPIEPAPAPAPAPAPITPPPPPPAPEPIAAPPPAPEPVVEIPEEPTVPPAPVAETPPPAKAPPKPKAKPAPKAKAPAAKTPAKKPAAAKATKAIAEEPTVPPPAPEPASAPAPAPAAEPEPVVAAAPALAPASAKADNLQLLKGVGPKMVVLLNGLGVTSFRQIADWTDADVAVIDPQLGAFQGRIARDAIVDQAGYLARGDKAGFEAKYGALGGEL